MAFGIFDFDYKNTEHKEAVQFNLVVHGIVAGMMPNTITDYKGNKCVALYGVDKNTFEAKQIVIPAFNMSREQLLTNINSLCKVVGGGNGFVKNLANGSDVETCIDEIGKIAMEKEKTPVEYNVFYETVDSLKNLLAGVVPNDTISKIVGTLNDREDFYKKENLKKTIERI